MSSPRTAEGSPVSSAFTPTFLVDGTAPDVIIVSSDGVCFYVHARSVLRFSANAFNGSLVTPVNTITVTESAAVINIVLNILCEQSCTKYKPAFDDVVAALVKYGASLPTLAVMPQSLFALLLSQAPRHAIDAYASAGQYNLEDVAVAIFAHLLAYSLSQLTDDLVSKMGPVYLKRILGLHQERLLALKDIVLAPPAKHPATALCNASNLTTAWAFAAAQLVWDARPSQ